MITTQNTLIKKASKKIITSEQLSTAHAGKREKEKREDECEREIKVVENTFKHRHTYYFLI
jgi:hypothetical protein